MVPLLLSPTYVQGFVVKSADSMAISTDQITFVCFALQFFNWEMHSLRDGEFFCGWVSMVKIKTAIWKNPTTIVTLAAFVSNKLRFLFAMVCGQNFPVVFSK